MLVSCAPHQRPSRSSATTTPPPPPTTSATSPTSPTSASVKLRRRLRAESGKKNGNRLSGDFHYVPTTPASNIVMVRKNMRKSGDWSYVGFVNNPNQAQANETLVDKSNSNNYGNSKGSKLATTESEMAGFGDESAFGPSSALEAKIFTSILANVDKKTSKAVETLDRATEEEVPTSVLINPSDPVSKAEGVRRRGKNRLGRRSATQIEMTRTKKNDFHLNVNNDNNNGMQRWRSQEQVDQHKWPETPSPPLVLSSSSPPMESVVSSTSSPQLLTTPSCVRKGVLWHQRDRLFSRWKERYFVLTNEYLQCFKRGSSRISEMGGFLFTIRMVDVDNIELLDRRGYLTIAIDTNKEGRVWLRRTEGIRMWFNALQELSRCARRRAARGSLTTVSTECFWHKSNFAPLTDPTKDDETSSSEKKRESGDVNVSDVSKVSNVSNAALSEWLRTRLGSQYGVVGSGELNEQMREKELLMNVDHEQLGEEPEDVEDDQQCNSSQLDNRESDARRCRGRRGRTTSRQLASAPSSRPQSRSRQTTATRPTCLYTKESTSGVDLLATATEMYERPMVAVMSSRTPDSGNDSMYATSSTSTGGSSRSSGPPESMRTTRQWACTSNNNNNNNNKSNLNVNSNNKSNMSHVNMSNCNSDSNNNNMYSEDKSSEGVVIRGRSCSEVRNARAMRGGQSWGQGKSGFDNDHYGYVNNNDDMNNKFVVGPRRRFSQLQPQSTRV